jgi:hypothetical protein
MAAPVLSINPAAARSDNVAGDRLFEHVENNNEIS